MKKFSLLVFLGVLATGGAASAGSLEWISTTRDRPWTTQPAPVVIAAGDRARADLMVDPSKTFQTIDGFGACFSEIGWEALSTLDGPARDQVLSALFSKSGAGFSLCRSPIGSSDFADGWYSLDESPGDFGLANFSIERDKGGLIPFIKAAMKFNPDLAVWGCPWSPPSWMKSNCNYSAETSTHLNDDKRTRKAYALYFEKYVQAYQAQGVPLKAVFVQNEPFVAAHYPSCPWTMGLLRDFIREDLGPRFAADGVKAQIWISTIDHDSYENDVGAILADATAKSFVTGVGYQYQGRGALEATTQNSPDLKVWETEARCWDGTNQWPDDDLFEDVDYYLEHGASAYQYWNMVLNETGKSHWDWQQNGLVNVDRVTHAVTYNCSYYVMRHFSAFVPPGSKRVACEGAWAGAQAAAPGEAASQPDPDDWHAVAFVNPAGQVVVVVNNPYEALPMKIQIGGRAFDAFLPATSYNTFVWTP